MALYMSQFSYTTEATTAMVKNPQDRSIGLKKFIKEMGGKLIGIYFCFGDYDGVVIAEMPDNVTTLALDMAVISAGHISKLKTTVLLPMEDTVKAMTKASKLVYAAPEG